MRSIEVLGNSHAHASDFLRRLTLHIDRCVRSIIKRSIAYTIFRHFSLFNFTEQQYGQNSAIFKGDIRRYCNEQVFTGFGLVIFSVHGDIWGAHSISLQSFLGWISRETSSSPLFYSRRLKLVSNSTVLKMNYICKEVWGGWFLRMGHSKAEICVKGTKSLQRGVMLHVCTEVWKVRQRF